MNPTTVALAQARPASRPTTPLQGLTNTASPVSSVHARTLERLVVVSNRLPVQARRTRDGWRLTPSPGGLVAALGPGLGRAQAMWIGWTGAPGDLDFDQDLQEQGAQLGCRLHAVGLSAGEVQGFYRGFCNEVIWPLFHNLQSLCNFDPEYWDAYETVNRRFAEAIARRQKPGDYVWVHDYHLMHVGRFLRERGGDTPPLGFFLHIPFPPADTFLHLPWRANVVRALLQYDLLGFQTPRDLRNFLGCAREIVPEVQWEGQGDRVTIRHRERRLRAGSFPIGIDDSAVVARAQAPEVTQQVRALRALRPTERFLLGVDRLDYTKGIPDKLRAFRRFLRGHPEWHERVTLVQILSPSREQIPRYVELRTEVERLVSAINGEFTTNGWVPVHYMHRHVPLTELYAWYRLADVALVTPLADGMNLVAKEYCASRDDEAGALILSEFAGVAGQLADGALLVNPSDHDEVAEVIHRALTMDPADRQARIRRLRSTVASHDVYAWMDSFLEAAQEAHVADATESLRPAA